MSCWGRGTRSASVARCQAASARLRWGEETGNAPAERPQPHDSTCPYVLDPAQSGPWGNKDVGIESLTRWTVPRTAMMMGRKVGGVCCHVLPRSAKTRSNAHIHTLSTVIQDDDFAFVCLSYILHYLYLSPLPHNVRFGPQIKAALWKEVLFTFSVTHLNALCVSLSTNKCGECIPLLIKHVQTCLFKCFQSYIVYIHAY